MVKNLFYIVVFSSFAFSCVSPSNSGEVADNSTYNNTALADNTASATESLKEDNIEQYQENSDTENKSVVLKRSVNKETAPEKIVNKNLNNRSQTITPKNNTTNSTAVQPSIQNNIEPRLTPTDRKQEEKLSTDLIFNDKTASQAKKPAKDVPRPILTFDYKEHDFGIVDEGDTVIHKFYFTNTGKAPAIISDATSSCGCTVPEYPKRPIKPNQRAYIKVMFDTKSRLNRQKKHITIKANTQPNYTTLYLRGDVYNRPDKKKEEEKKVVKKKETKKDTKPIVNKTDKKPATVDNKKVTEKETSAEPKIAKDEEMAKENAEKNTLNIQPPSVTYKVEKEEKTGLKFPKLGKKKKKE